MSTNPDLTKGGPPPPKGKTKRISSPVSPIDKKKPPSRTNAQKFTTYLEDTTRIGGFETSAPDFRTLVPVKSREIFSSLVEIYKVFFGSYLDAFENPLRGLLPTDSTGVGKSSDLLARVYISHWFYDQYFWIRESTRKIDSLDYKTHFPFPITNTSTEWDQYLAYLSAALRPTKIVLHQGTCIYIPMLDESQDFSDNEHPIPTIPKDDWKLDSDILSMIFRVIHTRKICETMSVPTDTFGRPTWLFDWNLSGTRAYSWFPQEGNYNNFDVGLAFVIGCACTPSLGFHDADHWRLFDYNAVLTGLPVHNYPRIMPIKSKASVTITTFVAQIVQLPNYYETDKDKLALSNTGPLAVILPGNEKEFVAITAPSEETSSGTLLELTPNQLKTGKHKEHLPKVTPTDTEKWGFLVQRRDYFYYTEVLREITRTHRLDSFRRLVFG